MSSNMARGDISRAGIINHSLALLQAILECGHYSREGLIRGNTVNQLCFSFLPVCQKGISIRKYTM